jgi:hypothetical protein
VSPRPQRVIAILGMHRSGTSCLTGSLQEAGLELGDAHTWNPWNRKGNRENQAFVDLHDSILAASGGAWDKPPRRVTWLPEHRQEAESLLAAHGDIPALGFKDPRCLLLLAGWKALVPDMERVGIFRHPDAVAESLFTRNQIVREDALSLWYAYNRVLYREYRQRPFPLLSFDDGEADFNSKVDAVVQQLGLQTVAAPRRFYDNELKSHGGGSRSGLPWKIRYLYYRLQRASL